MIVESQWFIARRLQNVLHVPSLIDLFGISEVVTAYLTLSIFPITCRLIWTSKIYILRSTNFVPRALGTRLELLMVFCSCCDLVSFPIYSKYIFVIFPRLSQSPFPVYAVDLWQVYTFPFGGVSYECAWWSFEDTLKSLRIPRHFTCWPTDQLNGLLIDLVLHFLESL